MHLQSIEKRKRAVTSSGRTFTDEILSDREAEILRQKTPGERLEMAFRLWSFAAEMIRDMARAEHPEWSGAELQRYVAWRMSHGSV